MKRILLVAGAVLLLATQNLIGGFPPGQPYTYDIGTTDTIFPGIALTPARPVGQSFIPNQSNINDIINAPFTGDVFLTRFQFASSSPPSSFGTLYIFDHPYLGGLSGLDDYFPGPTGFIGKSVSFSGGYRFAGIGLRLRVDRKYYAYMDGSISPTVFNNMWPDEFPSGNIYMRPPGHFNYQPFPTEDAFFNAYFYVPEPATASLCLAMAAVTVSKRRRASDLA